MSSLGSNDSRSVITGKVKVLNGLAETMIEAARSKIETTDFDALTEVERESAYSEVETLVRQAENVSSEASRIAARLA